jgi:hypothetical protein
VAEAGAGRGKRRKEQGEGKEGRNKVDRNGGRREEEVKWRRQEQGEETGGRNRVREEGGGTG